MTPIVLSKTICNNVLLNDTVSNKLTDCAAMAAFGNFALVKSMQRQLSEFDSAYGTYCMYWVLSLADYFAATSDVAFVQDMLPKGHLKMRRSKNRVLPKPLPPGAPPPRKGSGQYAGWVRYTPC